MLLLWLAAALADTPPSILAAFPEGPPLPGEDAPLLLYLPATDSAPDVTPARGSLELPLTEIAGTEGRLWSTRYRAAPDTQPDQLVIAGLEPPTAVRLSPPQPMPSASLTLTAAAVGRVNTGVRDVSLRVEGPDLPPPELLEVLVGEGRVQEIRPLGDGLEIAWSPGPSPFPRAVPIGVRDLRRSGVAPTWSVVRLTGSLSLPIRTEPGAVVTVLVGGRAYGPEAADARGEVRFSIEVQPGETTAQVFTEDALGNTQQSVLALGGDPLPSLALAVAGGVSPELPAPTVYVYAVRADGRPWRGAPPRCTLREAPLAPLLSLRPGEWLARAPVAGPVSCVLDGSAQATAVVPWAPPSPAALVLRLDPPVVSGDNPEAQITAYVVDSQGGRGDPGRISVAATHGQILEVTRQAGYIEARYDGIEAIGRGQDTLVARWQRPPGERDAWGLVVEVVEGGGRESAAVVRVRALDRAVRAAVGAEIQATLGGELQQGVTDAEGWLTLRFAGASEARVLSVRSGTLARERVVIPGLQDGVGDGGDLRVVERIALHAGRVRGIFLTTTPRVIAAETGSAQVEVRLVDAVGFPVLDAEVQVEASVGRLSSIVPEPDGSYYAKYTPPPGMMNGTVELSAMTTDGGYRASTDLLVVPRVYDQVLDISGGGLLGRSVTTGPGVWVTGRYARSPRRFQEQAWARRVWFLVEVGGYHQQIEDTSAKIEIVRLTSASGLGGMYRLQRGRGALWGGGALGPGVYWQRSALGGEEAARGLGVSGLGTQLFVGAGVQSSRRGGGEFQVQGRLFLLNQEASTIGWQGQVGGPAVTLGYNFLF